jgi:isopentenyl-diphosphate delta-isomerase
VLKEVPFKYTARNMGKENMVVLVDQDDNEIGLEEKLKAHQDGGKLHRAISVFVFNSKGQLMMQKRAFEKYHGGGLWSNTCCSHPFPGEPPIEAAHRRLFEEMGFDCDLYEVVAFAYEAKMDKGLTEKEYDHYFAGIYDGKPNINPEEVADWKWVSPNQLLNDTKRHASAYTPFFLVFFERVLNKVKEEGITHLDAGS